MARRIWLERVGVDAVGAAEVRVVDVVRAGEDVTGGWPVVHGFTGRRGGRWPPPDGLTLAAMPGLTDDGLAAHWRAALTAVDPRLDPDALVLLSQVHGDRVLVVHAPTGPLSTAGEADAAVTSVPGLALAVRVADCVPVLLFSPGGCGVVHAGWRGVASGVVGAAVDALREETGEDAVRAVIGPHIHPDAYEVGPEVIAGIVSAGVPEAVAGRRGRGDRWQAALGASVAHQLGAVGVERIGWAGGCTADPRWFSWRRQGPAAGRQAGVVAWSP